ncbi:MAG: PQQ-dependent sugar dehydrogenase [Gemmatimonadales bacterium]
MRHAVLLLLALGCINPEDPGPPPPPGTPVLQLVTAALTAPVFATSPPGDSARLFVVEQAGRIRIIRHDTLLDTAFLDIRGKIGVGGEQGLLSVAFHPEYATNNRFYVYFTSTSGDLRIVRYFVSSNPNVADSLSADTVLAVAHPTNSNHNGGQLQFGPDGKLYAGLGDGGSGGDPPNNAQNRHVLLGKLLRLDVDGATGYVIPPDNPFASDTSAEPEIWALGLRNPWRFSFDRETGDLYIADVGQNAWEEVDAVAANIEGAGKGLNFGWRIMEGLHCFNPAEGCDQTGLTLPVLEYPHAVGACSSITGGYVYRGTEVPALAGQYLYADLCAGFVRSFRFAGGAATEPLDRSVQLSPGPNISSFAEDARGELYVMTLGGALYRIVEANVSL